MAKLLSAGLQLWGQRLDNGKNIYKSRIEVQVVRSAAENFYYEKRGKLYRAQCGDVGNFYYYDKPGKGYYGAKQTICMTDGTMVEMIGPFSSNAFVINKAFEDRDPLIECVTNKLHCVIYITLTSLENLGMRFEKTNDGIYLADEYIDEYSKNHPDHIYPNVLKL